MHRSLTPERPPHFHPNSDDPAAAPLINHAQEVEKLADENKTLDAKLAELQRRLEKAEERRKAVEGQR